MATVLRNAVDPAEAKRIVTAANAYCRKFSNERAEQAISLLVLYKYFLLSGQIEPEPEVWRSISGNGPDCQMPLRSRTRSAGPNRSFAVNCWCQ
jgi:hypothetical protein